MRPQHAGVDAGIGMHEVLVDADQLGVKVVEDVAEHAIGTLVAIGTCGNGGGHSIGRHVGVVGTLHLDAQAVAKASPHCACADEALAETVSGNGLVLRSHPGMGIDIGEQVVAAAKVDIGAVHRRGRPGRRLG